MNITVSGRIMVISHFCRGPNMRILKTMFAREAEYAVLNYSIASVIDDVDVIVVTESLRKFDGSSKLSLFNLDKLNLSPENKDKLVHIVFDPLCLSASRFPPFLSDFIYSINQTMVRGGWSWTHPHLFMQMLRSEVISIDSDECLDIGKVVKYLDSDKKMSNSLCTLSLYNCFSKINLIDKYTYYEGPTIKPQKCGHLSIMRDVVHRLFRSVIYFIYKPRIINLKMAIVRLFEFFSASFFIYEWRYYGKRLEGKWGIHLNWFGEISQLQEKLNGYTSHGAQITIPLYVIHRKAIEEKILQWDIDSPQVSLTRVDPSKSKYIPPKISQLLKANHYLAGDLLRDD